MADLIAMLSAAASVDGGAAADPNFNQTTLLLHGDGTNGAQNNTFLDSSTNTFTITRNGNTTQGTFSPFSLPNGEFSNFFDGTGDYLTAPSNSAFDFGSGDFTIEMWIYKTVTGSQSFLAQVIGSPSAINQSIGVGTFNDQVAFDTAVGSTYYSVTTAASLTLNTWNHIACVRSSSTLTVFINGTSAGTGSVTGTLNSIAGPMTIGRLGNFNGYYTTGYISNLRIVKGTAVYTGAFTPSTTPLTAISGTSLLTCQTNRFKDNSTNNFAITVNGAPSVQPFSPFLPSAAYDPSVNGGSGYFDGSGDGVTTISSAMSYAGDYCIECFFYTNTTTTLACIYSDEASGTGATILLNNGSNNGQITTYGFGASNFASTTTGLNNNAWHHVAITLSGTTLRLFIDGVLENTLLSVPVPGTTTSTVRVGTSFFSGRDFGGYISNFRIVVGSPVYTSTFTPPTAPFEESDEANTELLLNFTNAGIFDNTGKNNLETVADAQIDTSVKKYGTGSMEFDGTGDYLFLGGSAQTENFVFRTGDFTIEMWVYFNSVASGSLFEFRPASTNGPYPLVYFSSSGVLSYYADGNSRINSSSVSTGQWYHFALARSGTSTKMFLNGTQTGSTYTDSLNYLCRTGGPLIGVTSGLSSDALNGYIDDLRITKGVARYTTTFTPPSRAFPDL
jgi:hypothetical protein